MWSGWSNNIALFISASYCMVKARNQPTVVVQHPATLPLERVLARVAQALKTMDAPANSPLEGGRLSVTLSASICPPLSYVVPAGIRNYNELQLVANASASVLMGIASEDLVCEVDPSSQGLLAALPRWWLQSLKSWAGQEKLKVSSIQPLWVIATSCYLARQSHIRAVCVQETAGITRITNSADSERGLRCIYMPRPYTAAPNELDTSWFADSGVDDQSTLKLSFSPTASKPLTQGPRVWAQHWQML